MKLCDPSSLAPFGFYSTQQTMPKDQQFWHIEGNTSDFQNAKDTPLKYRPKLSSTLILNMNHGILLSCHCSILAWLFFLLPLNSSSLNFPSGSSFSLVVWAANFSLCIFVFGVWPVNLGKGLF